METRVIGTQEVQFRAFEHAGATVSQHIALETDVTPAVFEDRIHGLDGVPFAVGVETIAGQLHRPGAVRAQPEIAAEVFVERGDVVKTQAVPFGVVTKTAAPVFAVATNSTTPLLVAAQNRRSEVSKS